MNVSELHKHILSKPSYHRVGQNTSLLKRIGGVAQLGKFTPFLLSYVLNLSKVVVIFVRSVSKSYKSCWMEAELSFEKRILKHIEALRH